MCHLIPHQSSVSGQVPSGLLQQWSQKRCGRCSPADGVGTPSSRSISSLATGRSRDPQPAAPDPGAAALGGSANGPDQPAHPTAEGLLSASPGAGRRPEQPRGLPVSETLADPGRPATGPAQPDPKTLPKVWPAHGGRTGRPTGADPPSSAPHSGPGRLAAWLADATRSGRSAPAVVRHPPGV